MTAPPRRRRGKSRGGKGLIPPNPLQWDAEHRALDLRDELSLDYDGPLPVDDAFACIPGARVSAVSEIPMARCHLEHLHGKGSAECSGAAIPLPDGDTWVVYNDVHSLVRTRATLMEEFFHLRLGHPPSRVRVYVEHDPRRSYDAAIEGQAYAAGAAALVPYYALRRGLAEGETAAAMGERLGVSAALVDFRLKVTRLWTRRVRRAKKAG